MASVACTDLRYKFYNGGWSSWSTSLRGGYAGSTSKVTVLRFKTPSISTKYKGLKLDIVIPYVRQSTTAKTGTLYVKLYTSDPTAKTSICSIPTLDTCDDFYSWNTSDQQVHDATFVITEAHSNLAPNTTHYLVIGASTNFMEIGYSGYDSRYSIKLTYTAFTDVTATKPKVTDHNNSTFTIEALAGNPGTNNPVKSTTLKYKIGTGSSYIDANGLKVSDEKLTCAATSASQTIYAKVLVDGAENDASATTTVSIKNYVMPNAPGVPKLTADSLKNNRLTIKQNWTYSWDAAAAANSSSPVKGYRIRLYKNNKTIRIFKSANEPLSVIRTGTTDDYIYDRESTDTTLTIDPVLHGFKPTDEVYLGIYSYTRNGNNAQLFSGGGTTEAQVNSVVSTVQNAGVVNVKVNNAWKEGQVFVKINGAWKEAETINVKVGGAWKESQ